MLPEDGGSNVSRLSLAQRSRRLLVRLGADLATASAIASVISSALAAALEFVADDSADPLLSNGRLAGRLL